MLKDTKQKLSDILLLKKGKVETKLVIFNEILFLY